MYVAPQDFYSSPSNFLSFRAQPFWNMCCPRYATNIVCNNSNSYPSAVILYLRTIALWARNRWILWSLVILYVVGLSHIHQSCDLPVL